MTTQLIIGFLPWIVFYLLPLHTDNQFKFGISILLALIIITSYKDLQRKFLLPWSTLLFFLGTFISVIILNSSWVKSYLYILSNGVLTILALGSLAIGKPFTIQYARLQVAKDKWHHPIFILINQAITYIWGLSFLLNLVLNILQKIHPYSQPLTNLLTTISTLGAILFTLWFPKWYPKHQTTNKRG